MEMLKSGSQMKNSGVKEIGSIPQEWKCVKIARIIENSAEGIMVGPFGSSLTGAVVGEAYGKYKVYGQANLIRRDFDFGDKYVNEEKYKELIRYKVIPGDVAISMMGTVGKCRVIPDGIREGIMDSHLIKARLSVHMLPEYFEYIYESSAVLEQIMAKSTGTIMTGLNSGIVKSLYVVLPPIAEQRTIASYLDDRCSKLDEIITEAEKSIEEYKELKQAVIFEAVTKGLDKNVPMKDSGISYIGLVPSHWKVLPNKYLMNKEKSLCEHWDGQDVMSLTMKGVIVRDLVNPTGKMPTSFDGYQFISSGDLLMCLFDIDVTPRCVGRVFHDGVTSPAYSNFKLHESASLGYYYYFYLMLDNTKELLHFAKSLRNSITADQLGHLKVPYPSFEEQEMIAEYLDHKVGDIDALISEKQSLIEDLKAYKKSLIYEVVTGKRRVV